MTFLRGRVALAMAFRRLTNAICHFRFGFPLKRTKIEFLGLPESPKLVESKLEQALLENLQQFLLELGKGFAFVSRQERITLDGDHYYIDLVFYHTILKCRRDDEKVSALPRQLPQGRTPAGNARQTRLFSHLPPQSHQF